ncbi:MAG TPA: tail fiber domain-containing protein [Longimicrobium sp.]|nr:tail fiber domain-containing protein [Longimicrobium sp.]
MKHSLMAAALALAAVAGSARAQAPADSVLAVSKGGTSLFRVNEDAAVVARGTFGVGAAPATGAGARMMWYPAKGAFRAGFATNTEWDPELVGDYSVALGYGGTASAPYTVALGAGTRASANYAVAMGRGSSASGQGSFAAGLNSYAYGVASLALGNSSTAAGDYSVALGNSTADGIGSVALGRSHSDSTGSAALGNGWARGRNALAFGGRADAFGVALGNSASTNGHIGAFVFGDASAGGLVNAAADNQVVFRAQRIWLGTTSTPVATSGRFLETSTGGYLSSGGTWTNSSDRNRKHGFMAVRGEEVLARLRQLPILTWSYRAEDGSVRHMGPTAQDFSAAFGLGADSVSIATVDADGVGLAAAQALEARTAAQAAEIRALRQSAAAQRQRMDALEARNAELEARLTRLEAALTASSAAAAPAVSAPRPR